jgi:hypothetical protein
MPSGRVRLSRSASRTESTECTRCTTPWSGGTWRRCSRPIMCHRTASSDRACGMDPPVPPAAIHAVLTNPKRPPPSSSLDHPDSGCSLGRPPSQRVFGPQQARSRPDRAHSSQRPGPRAPDSFQPFRKGLIASSRKGIREPQARNLPDRRRPRRSRPGRALHHGASKPQLPHAVPGRRSRVRYRVVKVMGIWIQTGTRWSRFMAAENSKTLATRRAASSSALCPDDSWTR